MPTELPPNPESAPNPPAEPRDPGRRPQRIAPHDAGSFPIAVVAGIPIRLHVTFLLLLAFLGFEVFGRRSESIAGLLLIVALFFCVILHELGHALVASRYGIRTLSITLYPIG